MYKIFLLLLFLTITPFAFSQQFYRSNSLGMELARISRHRTDDFKYFIEKTRVENRTVKILYRELVPIRETELHHSSSGVVEREIITENGIRTERIFNGLLLIRETITNISDQTGYIRVHNYDARRLLQAIDIFSLDGRLLSSISYERDSRGRLASVIRAIYLEGREVKEDQISKFRFDDRNLLDEWHGNSELTGTFAYHRDGRISEVLKTYRGEIISEKRYFYDQYLNVRTEEFIFETGKRIVRDTTSDGLLTEEIIHIGENFVSRTNDFYDDDDLLVRRVRVTPRGVERFIYEYLDGELISERMYFNGVIYKETVFLEEDVRYEDFFRDGVRVLRIHYRDNERTEVERW
ncbi:MAG: hypothetical protein FWD87_04600 [Spirochaetaceae bacterium]|nr:hypothetical protein [Spirochaetaceae bacterium]